MRWLAVLAVMAACGAPILVVERPADPMADAAITQMWATAIHGVARDGDWLLASDGGDLSQAAIYDAGHDTVIEAAGAEIREVPLVRVLERDYYVVLVRPSRMTATDEVAALDRARSRLGLAMDVGEAQPDALRGSELVFWASQTEARTGARERAVAPADLMKYGEVIYWSGRRNDPAVQGVALQHREL